MDVKTTAASDELTEYILTFFNVDDESGRSITELHQSPFMRQFFNELDNSAKHVIHNTTYSLVNLGLLVHTNYTKSRGTRYLTTARGREFLGLMEAC